MASNSPFSSSPATIPINITPRKKLKKLKAMKPTPKTSNVAVGGEVWNSSNVIAGSPALTHIRNRAGRIAFLAAIAFPVIMIALCVFFVTSYFTTDHTSSIETELQEEYGYEEVSLNLSSDHATVTTKGGEEKEVGYFLYKSAYVLFEDREQLLEKTAEVDAGTYPKSLFVE